MPIHSDTVDDFVSEPDQGEYVRSAQQGIARARLNLHRLRQQLVQAHKELDAALARLGGGAQ